MVSNGCLEVTAQFCWRPNEIILFLIPVGMVVLNPAPLEQNCESDDDSLEAVCGDDDETFSCCEDAVPGL